MKKEILIIFALVLFPLASAYLGISPVKQAVNFEPGMELEYAFNIFTDPGNKIELYSAGEFAELVEFDKKELIGEGSFIVKIKLPGKIEKPGKHRILIGAREKSESADGAIKAGVAVQAPIDVIVPYPGKYAEISFSVNNANVGEELKFSVNALSMGKESIIAETIIEIYSGEKKIDTLNLGIKLIENQKSDVFEKTINSSIYKTGNYEAIAIVDYQEGTTRESKGFRIGHLFINVTNYTQEIIKKGIQPFKIDIESLWNNPIADVYGEVRVLNDNGETANFLTPSISLERWEKKTLNGYVDTDSLELGEYDLKIKINYEKVSTEIQGKLEVKKEASYITYYIIGIIILIILIFLYIKFRRSFKRDRNVKKTWKR